MASIDWPRVTGDVRDLLRRQLAEISGETSVRAEQLEVLARDLAHYWALSQSGDESAEREVAHIRSRISLILAREAVEVRTRLEGTLLALLKFGVSVGKAVIS